MLIESVRAIPTLKENAYETAHSHTRPRRRFWACGRFGIGPDGQAGKLSAFDAGSKMLTLMTSKGNQEFMLAASTKIEEGSKTIDPDALQKLTGRNITVSYMESGGHRTVQSVHVSAPAHTTAPKKS